MGQFHIVKDGKKIGQIVQCRCHDASFITSIALKNLLENLGRVHKVKKFYEVDFYEYNVYHDLVIKCKHVYKQKVVKITMCQFYWDSKLSTIDRYLVLFCSSLYSWTC